MLKRKGSLDEDDSKVDESENKSDRSLSIKMQGSENIKNDSNNGLLNRSEVQADLI